MSNFLKRFLAVALVVAACSGLVWIERLPFVSSISPKATAQTMTINPRAPIIEWRYKFIDGKLYKRQYNCSAQEWIGEWQLVR